MYMKLRPRTIWGEDHAWSHYWSFVTWWMHLRGSAKNLFSQKSEITMEVGGWVQVSLWFFFLENCPKIALNECYYFEVVFHVYIFCLYTCIAKSCWLIWFECSVHVSDGFPKKSLDGLWGATNFFLDFWNFFNFAKPLMQYSLCVRSETSINTPILGSTKMIPHPLNHLPTPGSPTFTTHWDEPRC